jgi:hypothetical protein
LNPTSKWLAVLTLAALLPLSADATEYISRDEWPAIQRGIQVTQYARLAGVVNEFDRQPDSNIVILYPGGAAGQGWAEEIRDWFVALGIPSRNVALRPGSGQPGSLALQVETQGFK